MKKIFIIALTLCVSIIMVQPLMAQDETGAALTSATVGKTPGENNTEIAVGFYWGHCQYTTHTVGSAWTYCYDKNNRISWGTSDDKSEEIMIEAAGSANWIGFNVYSSSGSWSYNRLWEY
jgi:hypothetical protein